MIIVGTFFNPREHTVVESHFPDGTLKLDLPNIDVEQITWFYENDAELFTLMCVRDYYKDAISLYIPYLPHARMDRVKAPTDVFTLKTFTSAINAMKFSEVCVLDVHSNVSLALLNNVVSDTSELGRFHEWVLDEVCKRSDSAEFMFFFPDEGAMKRYSDDLAVPYAFGIKKRDWETGKILGLDIMYSERVKGKNILIVDDICSRGGTFYHSAKALKAAGAKNVYLCITHAEKTMLEGEMYNEKGLIDHIFTTDSIFPHNETDKVSVFSI